MICFEKSLCDEMLQSRLGVHRPCKHRLLGAPYIPLFFWPCLDSGFLRKALVYGVHILHRRPDLTIQFYEDHRPTSQSMMQQLQIPIISRKAAPFPFASDHSFGYHFFSSTGAAPPVVGKPITILK